MSRFEEVRRRLSSKGEGDHSSCYLSANGKVSLAELIIHLREVAPGKTPEEININFATVTWVDAPTAEEKAARAAAIEAHAVRHARWERETYERLKAKFEGHQD